MKLESGFIEDVKQLIKIHQLNEHFALKLQSKRVMERYLTILEEVTPERTDAIASKRNYLYLTLAEKIQQLEDSDSLDEHAIARILEEDEIRDGEQFECEYTQEKDEREEYAKNDIFRVEMEFKKFAEEYTNMKDKCNCHVCHDNRTANNRRGY